MSRSRKKGHIAKDSGSKPWMRRLTRSRMKTVRYEDAKYSAVVDTWHFNDHSCREWDRKDSICKIHEKYEGERRQVLENRHPLCRRYGKATALKRLDIQEKRELFQLTKFLRKK